MGSIDQLESARIRVDYAAGSQTPHHYRAYYPNPLPPEIEWTPSLAVALANASTLIGKLAGVRGRLPNPHVLIRPFVRREARRKISV